MNVVMLRLPPRIKVLEAAGAIADGRVKMVSNNTAKVVSSEGNKIYRVYIDIKRGIVYSDDNGTKLRGYIGYPIIAVLMLKGFLTFDKNIANSLKGIPWKRLNEQYRRYAIVENIVKNIASRRGVPVERIENYVSKVMEELSRYKFKRIDSPPLDTSWL